MAFSGVLPRVVNDVEAGGPIVTSAKAVNALTKSALENQYYAPSKQAEINNKNALTGRIPFENALTQQQTNLTGTEAAKNKFMMNNPAYINPDAFLMSKVMGQSGNNNGGQQQVSGFNRPVTGTPDQANAINNMQPGQDMQIGGNPLQSEAIHPFGITPPGTPAQTGNPQLDAMYAKRFGIGPQAQQQMEGYGDQIKQQIAGFNNAINEAQSSSNNANDANNNLKTIFDASSKMGMLESGAVGGHNRAWTDAAQQFDNAANQLVTKTAREWQSAHITNKDIELIQSGKINRTMNKEVRDNFSSMFTANNGRVQEKEKFLNSALNSQKMTIQQANQLWNMYQQQRPAYNSGDFIANNPYKNTWKDYLTPEAVNAVQNNQPYVPPNQQELAAKTISKKDIADNAKLHKKSEKQVREHLRQAGAI